MVKQHQQFLLREVEKAYGKKILGYADCLQLAKDITTKTGFRINVNTLRRFFGLVPANYPPSLTTLDILAKYTGFKSMEHFSEYHHPVQSAIENDTSALLNYLDTLFQKPTLTTYTDPTWMAIVRQTIIFLDKQPQLIDAFHRAIAKTIIGQEIYFEQFVNIDQLNKEYGNGLRYYLAEKQTKEAQILANSLLALRYFLTEDQKALKLHHEEVLQHRIDGSVHSFVCARYFASRLLYHEHHPEELFKIASEARTFFKELVPVRDGYQSFPCFELVMVKALILTCQPLEALFYIQESRKKKSDYIPPAVDIQLFSTFDLYEATAYLQLNEPERAKKALKKVNPSEFYFLSRHFHNILYLSAESMLYPGKDKTNEIQIHDLVHRTGFHKLLTIFEKREVVNKKEQEKYFSV